ncbi:MAG TPA: hypothetical protein VN541_21010, partial [Tepidisphaeraceae bacterium]|nr:hypothetical protein [Tepidisphaeraceae bacterium]
ERPIVITLREAPHWPARNSNLPEWLAFARICGHPVVFVRDTEKADEPLEGFRTFPQASRDVRVRLALYRRALVNMFVGNGPGELALISTDIPYIMFNIVVKEWGNAGTPEFFEAFTGVKIGGQFPWATPNQRLVWAPDDLPVLRGAFTDFMSKAGAPAL